MNINLIKRLDEWSKVLDADKMANAAEVLFTKQYRDVIKEIRKDSYRFYFITDGFKIKMLQKEELSDLLIKFVRMSDKKNQQKIIDEIKHVLRSIGEEGF